jgi:cell division protein FtsZ
LKKLARTVTQVVSKVSEKTIEEIAREAVPQICVIGVGGAGCNIVSWIKEKGVAGARIYALNTDAKHLGITRADRRILIGYKTCGGLGTGGFVEQGSKAAEESVGEVEKIIAGSGLVFITAGLGGGTGTGSSPVIARVARELGALTLGVVTIPFQVERTRMAKAKEGLSRLVEQCDAVVVIDNSKLRKIAGALPLSEAFAVANELIANFIKNISETIAIPSLVNLDFADLKTIMTGAKICAVGIGEGQGDTMVEDAVDKALNTQLLDIGDLKKSEGGLVHLEGGDDMTLEDVNKAGEIVISRVSPTAKVSWGARVNSKLEGTLRATIVLAGMQSPFLEAAGLQGLAQPTGPASEAEVVKEPEVPKKKGLFGF